MFPIPFEDVCISYFNCCVVLPKGGQFPNSTSQGGGPKGPNPINANLTDLEMSWNILGNHGGFCLWWYTQGLQVCTIYACPDIHFTRRTCCIGQIIPLHPLANVAITTFYFLVRLSRDQGAISRISRVLKATETFQFTQIYCKHRTTYVSFEFIWYILMHCNIM